MGDFSLPWCPSYPLSHFNKIINVSRFIMQFPKPKVKPKKINKLDQTLIDYIDFLTNYTDKQYELYDFWTPTLKLRHFLWEVFASHYIELVKARAYNADNQFTKEETESAKYTLYNLLDRLVILLYPIIPQVTTVITKALDISVNNFPKPIKKTYNNDYLKTIKKIMDFNSEVWKSKREKNISLRDSITNVNVPKELKQYEKDLKACHKLS